MIPALRARAALFELFAFAVRVACGAAIMDDMSCDGGSGRRPSSESSKSLVAISSTVITPEPRACHNRVNQSQKPSQSK